MGNYHELACVMGTYPSLAIFRTFKIANVRNLLILQAEISTLSRQLGSIIEKDRQSGDPELQILEKYVFALQNCEDYEEKAAQWNKIQQLRTLLKEYNSALLELRSLLRLPPANRTNLTAIRKWLTHDEGGANFLDGEEKTMWDDEKDLTSLVGDEENKDVISKWIDGPFISWFYHKIGYRTKNQILPIWDSTLTRQPIHAPLDYYPDSSPFVTVISTVFASTLPTLSIFALYYVTSPVIRLGMITLFTSLFALIITVFSKAKRADCFAATAGFAAVLVVFVGSTTGGGQTSSST